MATRAEQFKAKKERTPKKAEAKPKAKAKVKTKSAKRNEELKRVKPSGREITAEARENNPERRFEKQK